VSGSLAHITQPEAAPPRTGVRRWLSVLLALFLLAGSFALNAPAAHAGSLGVGYDIGMGFLGAYNTDVDGRQAYCADLDADSPFAQTYGPETITSLDSLSRQQLAELNYVLDRWGQSGDPNTTAAVALFVWSVTSAGTYNSHGMSGDDLLRRRAPASERGTILANLDMMRQERRRLRRHRPLTVPEPGHGGSVRRHPHRRNPPRGAHRHGDPVGCGLHGRFLGPHDRRRNAPDHGHPADGVPSYRDRRFHEHRCGRVRCRARSLHDARRAAARRRRRRLLHGPRRRRWSRR
jgi:hypothetical protein